MLPMLPCSPNPPYHVNKAESDQSPRGKVPADPLEHFETGDRDPEGDTDRSYDDRAHDMAETAEDGHQ